MENEIKTLKSNDEIRFELIAYANAVLALIDKCPYHIRVNMIEIEKDLLKQIRDNEREIRTGVLCF